MQINLLGTLSQLVRVYCFVERDNTILSDLTLTYDVLHSTNSFIAAAIQGMECVGILLAIGHENNNT